MAEGGHYGFYGGNQGGGLPISHMFPLKSPSIYTPTPQLAPPQNLLWGQSCQNSVNYNPTFFPSPAFHQSPPSSGWIGGLNEVLAPGVPITPSFPMDQSDHSMLYDVRHLNNYLDHPYTDSNKKVITPLNQISKGGVKKSKKYKEGPWTREEDRKLHELIHIYGVRNWAGISAKMAGRAGKQCRERWLNYQRPNIKRDEWTEDEERIFVNAHRQIGNKWAVIAKLIPGRTEIALKNYWNSTKRKKTCRNMSRRYESLYGKPKPTVLSDYVKSIYSKSKSTSTSTTIVSSDEYSSDSPSFDLTPPSDEEITYFQNLFGNSTTVAPSETNESVIQHPEPQSDPNIMMSPVGLDGSAEYGCSSPLFPLSDSFNNISLQNNDSQTDIQVSVDDYLSCFGETATFFDSSDLIYGYGDMNMDAEFNVQGGGFSGV